MDWKLSVNAKDFLDFLPLHFKVSLLLCLLSRPSLQPQRKWKTSTCDLGHISFNMLQVLGLSVITWYFKHFSNIFRLSFHLSYHPSTSLTPHPSANAHRPQVVWKDLCLNLLLLPIILLHPSINEYIFRSVVSTHFYTCIIFYGCYSFKLVSYSQIYRLFSSDFIPPCDLFSM